MTYAIGNIVYGIDLSDSEYGSSPEALAKMKALNDEEGSDILYELTQGDVNGFASSYSGSGDEPRWFGINDHDIDESNTIDGEWLVGVLTPTDELKARYQTLLDDLKNTDLPEAFQEIIRNTPPKMIILWGTS